MKKVVVYQLTMGGDVADDFFITSMRAEFESMQEAFPSSYRWILENTSPEKFSVGRILVDRPQTRGRVNYCLTDVKEPILDTLVYYQYRVLAELDEQDAFLSKVMGGMVVA
jgi:hypothetical protein